MRVAGRVLGLWLMVSTSLALAEALAEGPLKAGDEVRVTWPGTTVAYPGTVDRVGEGKYFVKFRGAVAPDDQWVDAKWIARVQSAPAPKLPLTAGARVLVSWSGAWYPATVLEVSGARAKIRYDKYDSSWDEWVGPDRLKPAPEGTPPATLPLPTGRFLCQSFEAGQRHNQGELVLETDGRYTDVAAGKQGTWKYDARTKAVSFTGVLAHGARATYDAALRHGAITFEWSDGARRTCYR